MWELDHKENWAPKNWCFQTVVLEKTLESPLDYKEIKPVNSTGKQLWIFIGRTVAEAEAQILRPPDAKNGYFLILVLAKTLREAPWNARRSNQSILKEINSEYSLEELLLKLKLQYFAHLMRRAHLVEKIQMLGKTEGRRRRGWVAEDQMVR